MDQVVSLVYRKMAGMGQPSVNEISVALTAAALVSFVLIYYFAEAQRRKRLPPGPWPWPVLGNFPHLGDMPHRALHGLAAKYGGLVYLRLGMNFLNFAHP